MTYQEDKSLVRTGNAARVMASLRSVAISLLRLDGHASIAAANRHHARDPQRTLQLLSKTGAAEEKKKKTKKKRNELLTTSRWVPYYRSAVCVAIDDVSSGLLQLQSNDREPSRLHESIAAGESPAVGPYRDDGGLFAARSSCPTDLRDPSQVPGLSGPVAADGSRPSTDRCPRERCLESMGRQPAVQLRGDPLPAR